VSASREATYRSLAVAGSVLIVFIGLCHEVVGAVVFPWGPAALGGALGWHGLGLGGILLALLLLAGVLGYVDLPVGPLSLLFVTVGTAITTYTAVSHREFHFFAVSLVVAAAVVAVCYRRSRPVPLGIGASHLEGRDDVEDEDALRTARRL
jgi:hypothetical protein